MLAACSGAAGAAEYSVEPYKTSAIEPARVLVEAVAINNWLNANHVRMVPSQIQGAREHLHALLDSRVKELYAKNGVLLPKSPDPVLAMLYSWAGRLGVFGADSVYPALKGSYVVNPPPGPKPPDGITVSLEGDSLVVSSSSGPWQAAVPFHYFIFGLQSALAEDSRRTEAFVVSTGSAPDTAPPGYSQATLAVFFTQGADIKAFEAAWSERLQIPVNTKQTSLGEAKYSSRRVFDLAMRLHKEVVFIPSSKGSFVVLYSGLDGTYQLNRPHFLSFLQALKVPE
jgi:hypothetical protein